GPAWDNYIKLLGEGEYDVALLLHTLREIRYSGPIGIQFYGVKGDSQENLAATMRAWRELVAPFARPHPGQAGNPKSQRSKSQKYASQAFAPVAFGLSPSV